MPSCRNFILSSRLANGGNPNANGQIVRPNGLGKTALRSFFQQQLAKLRDNPGQQKQLVWGAP